LAGYSIDHSTQGQLAKLKQISSCETKYVAAIFCTKQSRKTGEMVVAKSDSHSISLSLSLSQSTNDTREYYEVTACFSKSSLVSKQPLFFVLILEWFCSFIHIMHCRVIPTSNLNLASYATWLF
jgi:hypothetical protein